jgi:hypothetical protein
MVNAISLLVNAISNLWNGVSEKKEEKYRRDMVHFLNQATDRVHLEWLEREWDNKHGRKYW